MKSTSLPGSTSTTSTNASQNVDQDAPSRTDANQDTSATDQYGDSSLNTRISQVLGHGKIASSIAPQITQGLGQSISYEEGSVLRKTNAGDEQSDVSPGWWGIGQTLNDAQSTLHHQRMGQAQSGDGANIGNAEARTYDLFYSGSSKARLANSEAPDVGTGIGGGFGAQARADAADEQLTANASNSLSSASAQEQASVGAQTDAEGMLYAGNKGVGAGASVGAFTGARAGVCLGASTAGVGASETAEAWAGYGVKATAEASLKNGKLSADLGFGAALDVGGYSNLQATIDLNQIADELKSIGSEAKTDADKGKKIAGIVGEAVGGAVGAMVGTGKLALSATKSAVDTASDVAKSTGDKVQSWFKKV
jgi:hypothetical protein